MATPNPRLAVGLDEEKRKTMNAMEELGNVLGGAKSTPDNGGDASAARIAELERQLQQERVESGRLRKANDELAQLRAENAQLKAAQRGDGSAIISSLPKDVVEPVPDDIKRMTGAAIETAVSDAITKERERYEAELAKLREEGAQSRRTSFARQINTAYPSFFADTREGGKLYAQWSEYMERNGDSLGKCLGSFDYDATKYHIDRFYSEYGISNPSGGQGGTAAPEPRSIGGGVNPGAGDQKKTYTYAEYNELRKKAHALRDAYDFEKYRALAKELDDAIAEGRVKE